MKDRSILVVDDEPGIIDLVRMTLQGRGMAVTGCSSVAEALRILDGETFDFILSDMKMPGKTGKDFFETLSGRDARMPPFILMAGDPTERVTIDFTRQSNVPLLQKPFAIQALLEILMKQPRRLGARR